MITVTHARIELAIHELKSGDGRPLLHLHGLGLQSPDSVPDDIASWRGPIFALDFTGHGKSQVPKGGGYTPELLMGDVDAALQHIGEATLIGRGLGAWVAFMTAAARPDVVRGAILADGPGMSGGGPAPGTPTISRIDPNAPVPPDPYALAELSKDVRPPDYALDFAHLILQHSRLPQPIAVCARSRPEWLDAVIEELGISPTSLEDALRSYANAH